MSSKRKREEVSSTGDVGIGAAGSASAAGAPQRSSVLTSIAIEQDFELAVAKVRNGTYQELARLAEGLARIKEKKIAAADKHRKLQIKNINDLYEYEVSDASARYKRAYEETQERLIAELTSEARRLKFKLQSARAATEKEKEGGGSAAAPGGKLMRTISSSPDEIGGPAAPEGEVGTLSGVVHGKEKDRTSKRRLGGPPNPPTSLDPLLPEESMRSDFLEIVQDIQSRAAAFAKSSAKPGSNATAVSVTHDPSVLKVGQATFGVGDLVVVFSVLSQESLSGVITTISDRDVVVRSGSGARFSFLIGQLRQGRITISKDKDSELSIKMIQTSSSGPTSSSSVKNE